MNVFGKKFTFNGISSDQYDVLLCAFESPETTINTAIAFTINKSELTPFRSVVNTFSRSYTDVLRFSINICKCNGKPFFETERRDIVGWITSPKYPALFTIEHEEYHEDIEYFCQNTNYSEFRPNGNIHGLIFEMECNTPYGFSPEEVTKFDITDADTITINNTSDEWNEDYYPVLELEGKETGTVTVLNAAYPETVMELKIKNGQRLLIENQEGDIVDNVGIFDYSTDTNLKWLRLKHGENVITISGNVKGCIKCRYIRKVGM